MLDFVALAMVVIMVVLMVSIWLVRKKKYNTHKIIQIVTAIVLLVSVLAFELDMRLFTDWRQLAEPSPWYESGWVTAVLYVHLVFAIPTPFVWGFVIWQALRKFDRPPRPGVHSVRHKRWGWIATILMLMTTLTGWGFYWLAFVAS